MIRPRATNSYGNRSGGRARAKVTSHRSRPRKATPKESQYGRGVCPHCREMKPLLSDGRLRGHDMYGVTCMGYHKFPVSIQGES